MKKLHCALCILVFSLSLATAFFLNVVPIIKQVVAVTPPEEIKAQIESYLGENVYGKEMFTEVYAPYCERARREARYFSSYPR